MTAASLGIVTYQDTPVVEAVESAAQAASGAVEAVVQETTPAVQTPVVETPAVQTPVVESPAVQTPVVETPATQTPAVQTPVVETPAVETLSLIHI